MHNPLTDWVDHRSRPFRDTGTCTSRKAVTVSLTPGDGFLPSRHEMGGTASSRRPTPGNEQPSHHVTRCQPSSMTGQLLKFILMVSADCEPHISTAGSLVHWRKCDAFFFGLSPVDRPLCVRQCGNGAALPTCHRPSRARVRHSGLDLRCASVGPLRRRTELQRSIQEWLLQLIPMGPAMRPCVSSSGAEDRAARTRDRHRTASRHHVTHRPPSVSDSDAALPRRDAVALVGP